MKPLIDEIEISYRPSSQTRLSKPIKSSSDAYEYLKGLYDPNLICAREEFIILYLNTAGQVLGFIKAFTGGVSSVSCDLRIILAVALKSLSSGIIISHNHPSGTLKASTADINLTKRVNNAAKLLDLKLLDHLILSDRSYLSLADQNLLNGTE